jgi:hypothetical protein
MHRHLKNQSIAIISNTQMIHDKDSICQALKENKKIEKEKGAELQHQISIINDIVHSWYMQIEVDVPTLSVTCNVLETEALAF